VSPPQGRRRADRAGWPLRDRIRWRRARICAGLRELVGFVRSAATLIAVLVAILLAGGAVIYAIEAKESTDRANAKERERSAKRADAERRLAIDRDEARKYQACVQRKRGLRNQNLLAQAARGSLLTAHRRQSLQARKTTDRELRVRFLTGSHLALVRRRQIRLSQLPRCRATYPTGYAQRDRFPDLAKQGGPPPAPAP
jgi:hypothetical protein